MCNYLIMQQANNLYIFLGKKRMYENYNFSHNKNFQLLIVFNFLSLLMLVFLVSDLNPASTSVSVVLYK